MCNICYETNSSADLHQFSCGDVICQSCFISDYSQKVKEFIKLCEDLDIDQINSCDIRVNCLKCNKLLHPYPGEYLLSRPPISELPNLPVYRDLLILKLDGIECEVQLTEDNNLCIYIQGTCILTV